MVYKKNIYKRVYNEHCVCCNKVKEKNLENLELKQNSMRFSHTLVINYFLTKRLSGR